MAVWTCADCTARYAVGAPRCPQCGCRVRVEDGSEDDMAKVTVHGGPSDALAALEDGEFVVSTNAVKAATESGEGAPASAPAEEQPSEKRPARTRTRKPKE